jgi:hemolysin D
MTNSQSTSNALTLVRRRSAGADPTLPVILEFQWPSTAIANAPIPRSARGIAWVISSMVVVLIGAMAVIPIDQVVTARGIAVPTSPTIVVQPLETAIVRSIEVREGQQVRAGEVLARLDPTFAAADLGALTASVSSLEAEVARLRAEAEGKPFVATPGDPDMALQYAIYAHRKAEYDSNLENYARKLGELNSIVARSHSDAAGYAERLGLAKDVEHMRQQLQTLQVGSRLSTLSATDSRTEMARSLANAEETEAAAKEKAAGTSAERDAYVWTWQADLSQKLAEALRKFNDAKEQLSKAKLRRQLVELRAERDAVVQSIAKVSVGSVLQSGQNFFTLVPVDAPLEIEASIAGREEGFIHVGDPVTIKFDTFPFSQYGKAEGSIRVISPSSFTPQDEARNPTGAVPITPSEPETVYRARITVDQLAMHGVPGGFRMTPGMPVTTDIKVGKRTVLGYLLGRIIPITQEGMREP